MGAHTLGAMHERISNFHRYSWTRKAKYDMNNEYYQVMTMKFPGTNQRGNYRKWKKPSDKRLGNNNECNWSPSHWIGNEKGQPWNATWLIFNKARQDDAGPFLWMASAQQCDLEKCRKLYGKLLKKTMPVNSCCHHFYSLKGQHCIGNEVSIDGAAAVDCNHFWCDSALKPDQKTLLSRLHSQKKQLGSGKAMRDCNHFGEPLGKKESNFCKRRNQCKLDKQEGTLQSTRNAYLNVDMGMYVKFDTVPFNKDDSAQWGKPIECKNKNKDKEGWRFIGCPLNDDSDGKDGEKMYETVEFYAQNNQAFVNDFAKVFVKMLENGYDPNRNPKTKNAPLKTSKIDWQKLG